MTTDFEWLSGAEPGPGGEIAYVSDATGRPQVRLLRAARHLPVDGSVRRCAWRPDGTRLLVLVDPDGGEDHRLAEIDPVTGAVEWLVAEPGVRCEVGVPYGTASAPYSPDSRLLAYASNARDREVFDVHVRDLATGATRTVLTGDDRWLPVSFSPDATKLLVLRLHQNTEHDLVLCDLRANTVTPLTDRTGPDKYEPIGWLPDSSGIHVCTTHGRDFMGLATLSLDGTLTWTATPPSDVEGGAVRGDLVVWGVDVGGWTRLHWTTTGSGVTHEVEGLPPGVAVHEFGYSGFVPRFTHDGRLLVQLGRPDAATELYLADLAAGTAEKLTDFGARLPNNLVVPREIRATSADGLRVRAHLYTPHEPNGALVVTVHGGPEYQAYPTFDPLVQELLARGIGVLAPDIRGSSGHGLRHQRLIYGDWGGGDLDDLAAITGALADVDWVDTTRLGVHGASYGGFAALSCVSRLPHLWRAGVSECGSSDLVTDMLSAPPTWRKRLKAWIGDVDDPVARAELTARGPLANAYRVTAPVLLLHGENDTRVDPEESERMYRRLKELGKPVELVRHPGVGHEVDRESLAATVALIADWFTTHLG
ncbi:S9 family peptidase [Saccharothrix violaceirubra]|uniref:Dipeptidyl aminopeptidase/acylaminoacyl peptidase n=1 Tax=Saccharothrix violaceirubra TaxID=413306 RepID=A0A7W7T5K3_9PSEU|nr:prolyl oligopeptidase family serine peptidase [Saccharothrix violaceirubra]MBB4967003.1 dipeptidyl aminopeptidase/acylaminoacyl peptidase [Saccharothrix violaceirubra]